MGDEIVDVFCIGCWTVNPPNSIGGGHRTESGPCGPAYRLPMLERLAAEARSDLEDYETGMKALRFAAVARMAPPSAEEGGR